MRSITLTFIVAVAVCGCRIKSPSMAEQQYLIQKGSFPGGTPEWIASPSPGGSLGGGFSGGFIPQSFIRRVPGQSESQVADARFAASPAGSAVTPKALEQQQNSAAAESPNSPLARIASVCPSIESEVNDALLTTDLRQRIRKYESLTVRCPNSGDLWLWLGKDYSKDNQLVKDGRSFESSLIADASLTEAQELLDANRKELNRSGEKGKDAAAPTQR